MSQLPDSPTGRGAPLPERRLSSPEFEAVIRRAAELQARSMEEGAEAMSESEVLRIGQELGLSPAHLGQALAEVGGGEPADPGLLDRSFGAPLVRASRIVPRDADTVRRELETYLLERECMVVQRRLADRTIYHEGSGAVAAITRAANRVGSKRPLLGLKRLEVAVRPVDETRAFVTVAVDLRATQIGLAAGGTAVGTVTGATAAGFLFLIEPVSALAGLVLFAPAWLGFRSIFRHQAGRTAEQLESLLDRLEHRELVEPSGPGWRQRLGI